MSSPLGPLLANVFMGTYLGNWLSINQGSGLSFHRRYMENIFLIFQNLGGAFRFLDNLNSVHKKLNLRLGGT